jgi:hypothetical protein
MHVFVSMRWRVYTRLVKTTDSVAMRWYWCRVLPEGREESGAGFTSRLQCEADAVKHGCRVEDQADERRTSVSRLFFGAELREDVSQGSEQ